MTASTHPRFPGQKELELSSLALEQRRLTSSLRLVLAQSLQLHLQEPTPHDTIGGLLAPMLALPATGTSHWDVS